MKIEIVLVTPEMASEWLKKNNNNRPLRKARVRHYAELMRTGKWEMTHQGVAMSEDGTLIDGQHRLAAIVTARVNVKMAVATIARGAAPFIDNGAPRTVADNMRLWMGTESAKSFAAVLRLIFQLDSGSFGAFDYAKAVEANEMYGADVSWSVSRFRSHGRFHVATFLAAMAYVHSIEPNKVEELAQRLTDPEASLEGMSRLINDYVVTNSGSRGGSNERTNGCRRFLHAIWLYCRGENRQFVRKNPEKTYEDLRRARAKSGKPVFDRAA